IMLRALVERRIGRRDQANAWIWRLAEYTRDVHEEYAVQRWPETKRLLGLLVNSAGGAHARNARRLIHAARKQDRRLAAALLAAALAHTPEDGAQASRAGPRAPAQLPQTPRPQRAAAAQGRKGPRQRRGPHGRSDGVTRGRPGRPDPGRAAPGRARRARARRHAQLIRSRCTSPEPIAVWPPCASPTTSRPSPSMPCARPLPPLQATSRPFSASRSRHASSVSAGSCARRPSSACSSRVSVGSISLGAAPIVAAGRPWPA